MSAVMVLYFIHYSYAQLPDFSSAHILKYYIPLT